MSDHNQIERIEKYNAGSMSANDATLFEKDLATDPSLKAENNFQSDIINGLKEYRKTQLKCRLDAIDITPRWFDFAQQSTLVKSFGGIAVATIVGGGIFLFSDTKEEASELDNKIAIMDMNVPVEKTLVFDWNQKDIDSTPSEADPKRSKQMPTANEPAREITASLEATTAVATEVLEEKAQSKFYPNFISPDADDIAETELTNVELDEVLVMTSVENVSEPIDIETENTKSSKIRYKYYDGKLFLNGDFNQEPYEILEINSAKGRRIYLLK